MEDFQKGGVLIKGRDDLKREGLGSLYEARYNFEVDQVHSTDFAN